MLRYLSHKLITIAAEWISKLFLASILNIRKEILGRFISDIEGSVLKNVFIHRTEEMIYF